MKDYEKNFIELAMADQVLSFGDYTLKSGRKSPYFFNAGLFNSGRSLAELGNVYAQAIVDSGIEFDVIFGPAYKGIPLVAAISIALWNNHNKDVPYAFNRKEAKDHGEGGVIVGSSMKDKRVLVVDDVITAGTAIREAIGIISHANGSVAGVVIALDRQEIGKNNKSAIQEVEAEFHFPVRSVVKLDIVIEYLSEHSKAFDSSMLDKIKAYRETYASA